MASTPGPEASATSTEQPRPHRRSQTTEQPIESIRANFATIRRPHREAHRHLTTKRKPATEQDINATAQKQLKTKFDNGARIEQHCRRRREQAHTQHKPPRHCNRTDAPSRDWLNTRARDKRKAGHSRTTMRRRQGREATRPKHRANHRGDMQRREGSSNPSWTPALAKARPAADKRAAARRDELTEGNANPEARRKRRHRLQARSDPVEFPPRDPRARSASPPDAIRGELRLRSTNHQTQSHSIQR